MKVVCILNRQEISELQTPIIVEGFSKLARSLSVRRKFEAAFTQEEREYIRGKHGAFHTWYVCKGTPDEFTATASEIELIKRAVQFFATV